MKDAERQLLHCLAAYRMGRETAECVGSDSMDWSDLHELARIHKLTAVVYETLRSVPGFCGENAALAAAWRTETIAETVGQTMRTGRLLAVTVALDEEGIAYAVVKGAVCRELYSRPDLRPSGDEDILIRTTDIGACRELFLREGLELLEEKDGDPVTHWGDRRTGLHIELHTALMPSNRAADRALDDCFSEGLDSTVTVTVQGGSVKTLCPTLHFLFLVCHALKHFISGGFGIRTVCDIVSFAEHYASEIDKEAVYVRLQAAGGRVFLDQIFTIGREHLEFDPEAGGWELSTPPDAEEMLEDILDAGIYGQSSMSRRHSAGLVLGAAENGSSKMNTLAVVFPGRERMAGRYPVLKRLPLLLPLCWAHRLGAYAVELLRSERGGNSPLTSVAMGKKRTEMMIRYGILPQDQKKN